MQRAVQPIWASTTFHTSPTSRTRDTMTAAALTPRSGVRSLLPIGLPLSEADWNQRHRLILIVLALHLPILGALAAFAGHGSTAAQVEFAALVVLPGIVAMSRTNRTVASSAAALALLGTSATMVELLGGSTSAHFSFFVSLGFIALYQSWPAYLLAVGFTAVHHVGMALLMPMHLFGHGSAEAAQPVLWALVHAVFVLAGAAAQITFWRFAEGAQLSAAAAESTARTLLADQLVSEQAGADDRAAAALEIAETLASQHRDRAEVDQQLALLTDATHTVSGGVSAAAEAVGAIDVAIRQISADVSDASAVSGTAVGLVDETSTAMAKLGDEVEEIGRLVGVISGIAAQTNLLALNATIEAARAGDAGKGFAVVAAEVKTLARDTATATETIGALAGRIRSETDSALHSMGKVSSVIGQISGYTTSIAAAVDEQSATTALTRSSFTEVADGANSIADAVRELASR